MYKSVSSEKVRHSKPGKVEVFLTGSTTLTLPSAKVQVIRREYPQHTPPIPKRQEPVAGLRGAPLCGPQAGRSVPALHVLHLSRVPFAAVSMTQLPAALPSPALGSAAEGRAVIVKSEIRPGVPGFTRGDHVLVRSQP